jgi:glycosyltransferase involved in cell wall biosynthesis
LSTPNFPWEVFVRLDIVIPAHNEEHRIGRTLSAYRTVCGGRNVRFQVALDGCTDRTAEIVNEHRGEDDRVSLHEYPKLGKGGVIAQTFRASDADVLGFVDADCATPPAEMLRLADVARHAGGAIASRHHPASVLPRHRTRVRRATSAGFAFGVRRLLGLGYSDTQCGAKVLRRDAAERILPRVEAQDLLFDVELLLAARETGQEIVEVPTVWIDQDGSRVDPVADTRRMSLKLLQLWAAGRRREVAARA